MATRLDRELRTYEKHFDELLASSADKFVLIKKSRVIGVFENVTEALKRGYDEFGNEPFLVRQVLREEAPQQLHYRRVKV